MQAIIPKDHKIFTVSHFIGLPAYSWHYQIQEADIAFSDPDCTDRMYIGK